MPDRNTQRKKKESNLHWEVEKTGWDESNMVKAGKLKRSLGVQPFLKLPSNFRQEINSISQHRLIARYP